MKMKERFHAICRFLTMVSQGNHRVLFWLLGSAFAAATLPYLSLFFSARILNLLLAKSYRVCLYTVVVFLLTQYGLGLFEKICRQYLDGQKELCLARTEQKITAKALELEFEKFEKTETMDAIRRTNVSSMGSGNVGDQLIVIHTLITSLLSVLYALFFLLRLFLLSDSSRKNFFTSPFSMRTSIGIDMTPNFAASSSSSSTLTFTKSTSSLSSETSSTTGESILQGPHQFA